MRGDSSTVPPNPCLPSTPESVKANPFWLADLDLDCRFVSGPTLISQSVKLRLYWRVPKKTPDFDQGRELWLSGFWDNQLVSTALNVSLSLEEFIARPEREDGQREELIEGELIVSPAAKVWHAAIVGRLRANLAPLREHGFMVENDFACILGRRSMPAPDLAAVSIERWNQAEDNDGWLDGAPELSVEVASPSNRKLQQKAVLYLEHGAEQVWIVYRKTQTVTVMTPDATTEARMGETLEFRGLRIPVASFMKRAGN